MTATQEQVLAAVAYDEALTTQEVAARACGADAWAERGNVRNRLYELEAQGLVICDENRPMRWLRPGVDLGLVRWLMDGTAPTRSPMLAAPECYGCLGTGYHVGFGMPPLSPCLHHGPDCDPESCTPPCELLAEAAGADWLPA